MKCLMLACSRKAYEKLQLLQNKIKQEHPEWELIVRVKCKALSQISMPETIGECVGTYFHSVDIVVFFGAVGIAVRAIAPSLVHKASDPAVIVVDETAAFSIALTAGHAGGANALAQEFAAYLGAQPVITTATDREGKLAVDEFARVHHMTITDWKLAKELSAAMLEGTSIGVYVEPELRGIVPIPDDPIYKPAEDGTEKMEYGIVISHRTRWTQQALFRHTLQLIPHVCVVGIGCRRGTTEEAIRRAVRLCLTEQGIRSESVGTVVSTDLKKEEPGLVAFCRNSGVEFETFSAETLQAAEGEFTASDFVKQITGVDNVCERSVVAAGARLICHKQVYTGVTVAFGIPSKE